MALKMLLLRSKLEKARTALEELRSKDADFTLREEELEAALNEVNADTSPEEQAEVEKQIDEFEADKNAHEEAKGNLEKEIEKLEGEMSEEEKRNNSAAKPKAAEERKEGGKVEMNTRTKFFGMSAQERDSFFAREDVKDFLARAREFGSQKRAVTGAELLIPTVVLDLIKENVMSQSKLYKHVNARFVPGKARQNIMGTIPEAVWTEMCGILNELNLSFANVEVDGYKVGGYIAICNAVLEDSDINLASEIITALGQAIGLALDKAILYGTGTKMPLGIVTRLVQTAQPDNYSARNRRAWQNLSASNVQSISGKSDAQLFKALVTATGAIKNAYNSGEKFWAMSEKTKTTLVANAMSINAAGAIVSGIESSMPIIGGAIETLDFIPDNVIIGGYGKAYLLAERAGTAISQSEHVRFIEDQTVIKGTARYDGMPVIPESFIVIDIAGGAVSASAVTFTEDLANGVNTSSEE